MESSGGIPLLAAAIVAFVRSNPRLSDTHERVWTSDLTMGVGGWAGGYDLRHMINVGLMALLLPVVGSEVDRDFPPWEPRNPRSAVVPIVAVIR
jgi:NhaA family Na+:H+ antiporter